jgi:O-antigen ligase
MSKFSYDIRDAGPLGYAGVNGLAAYESNLTLILIAVWPVLRNHYLKLFVAGIIALNLYCLLFAFSRGAYAGFLAGVLVLALLKYRWLLIPIAVLALAWTAVLPPAVIQRITGTYSGGVLESSAAERVELWEDALNRIGNHPIFGSGYETYAISRKNEDLRDTHNYYLKVLVETGIIGICVFLFLLSKMWATAFRVFRREQSPLIKNLALGMVACMASLLVVNFFGDRWTYVQVNALLWALLGVIARYDVLDATVPVIGEEEKAARGLNDPLVPASSV